MRHGTRLFLGLALASLSVSQLAAQPSAEVRVLTDGSSPVEPDQPVNAFLDPTFDGDGIAYLSAPSASSGGTALVPGMEGAVARDSLSDMAAVTVGQEEKILVSGVTYYQSEGMPAQRAFFVARMNTDGSLDPGFGGGLGIVRRALPGDDLDGLQESDRAKLAVLSDGRFVVAGSAKNAAGSPDFVVLGFNADGSVNGNFGSRVDKGVLARKAGDLTANYRQKAGLTYIDFIHDSTADNVVSSSADTAYDVTASGDRIYVVGRVRAAAGGSSFFGLAALDANGELDTTCGGTGKVTLPFRPYNGKYLEYAVGVAVDSRGRIIIAGKTDGEHPEGTYYHDIADVAVTRLNADCTFDAGFGGITGKVITNVEWGDQVGDVLVDGAGNVFVGGTDGTGHHNATLIGYNPNGTLKANFGNQGVVQTEVLPSLDTVEELGLAPDGRIVAAVSNNLVGTSEFILLRYTANGVLEKDGEIHTDLGGPLTAATKALAVQGDGRIVLGGNSNASGTQTPTLVRYQFPSRPVFEAPLRDLKIDATREPPPPPKKSFLDRFLIFFRR
ncbi:MAG TPA: hypothetical protein VLJ37_00005 [bacterium]|nr:hypothetical protein [bacterium]